ncbi:MAG: hypothetical protein C4524_00345 [Candidatus Zixiibacteriota bacterium]|nr:MAG: hypothetical protein C4524_00345 [candidate division Zixibacteria bacterium]
MEHDISSRVQGHENEWRIRIGNHWILYTINPDGITIFRITHRKDGYRRW